MAAKTYLKSKLTILTVLFLLAQLTFAAPPRYEIIDLSTRGCGYSTPYAINDIGQVAGISYSLEGGAFLWDRRIGMIDLGVLYEGDWSIALGVNDHGQVVGFSGPDDGSAFIWDRENGMRCPEGAGYGNDAYAINNAGQVVIAAEFHSYLWHPDEVVSIDDTLGADRVWACALNSAGQVVGHAYTSHSEYHAFLWDCVTGMRDLGTLGGTRSMAFGINDTGQVVGKSLTTTGDWHAFLWNSDTGMVDLGEGQAHAINNAGQVVGYMSSSGPAFYWDRDNGLILLSDLLLANSGWRGWKELKMAEAINNRGQIVGCGYINADLSIHAFLMTPVLPTIYYIYYVDDNAPGPTYDGLSWATAFKDLQDALYLAWHKDEIWVAQGIYKPDQGVDIGPGDRTATFNLINGVAIKGGYAGCGAAEPNARDIELYETILTGDLNGDDGPNFVNYEENSYHVVTVTLTNETAVLDGFTITAGNANDSSYPNSHGGAMFCDSGATVSNCTFAHSFAVNGGGMCCNSWWYEVPGPRVTNCAFIGNRAGNLGGGLWLQVDDSDLILTNCTFSGNVASDGGGIFCWDGSPTISNCILWDNKPEELYVEWGAPVVTYSDVRGSWPGEGNIDLEPCFAEPGYWDTNGTSKDPNDDFWVEGDYHLMEDSPCVDAGDPNYIAEPNETDLDGKPRVIAGRIDMGAYESPIFAEARILPQTINLASKGNWITCYIWLPEGYNVADIESNCVFLENEIQPEQFSVDEQQQVATARFTREDVQPILEAGDINLKITGQLTDGTVFEATDTIKVIDKAGKN